MGEGRDTCLPDRAGHHALRRRREPGIVSAPSHPGPGSAAWDTLCACASVTVDAVLTRPCFPERRAIFVSQIVLLNSS